MYNTVNELGEGLSKQVLEREGGGGEGIWTDKQTGRE